MFRKPQLSSTDQAEFDIAKEEMLRISPAKPLGYLEKGIYKEQIINPRCIHYVPEDLINKLMAKKDIYILSSQYDEGKKIEWKGTHSQNPNIILLEEKEKLAGNKAMVFHKEALKNLLKCNESIVLGMLNREKFFADAKIGIRSTKENRFKKIDDSVVNAFVELVGRKDFSIGANECKALVDAAFADNNFLQNATWRKIKLTNELNEYFIQKYFPQWGQVDWKAIEKEYNEKKTFMSSSESHVLSNNIISPLAKGDKSLHYIDAINQYIKKYPERKLSKIILSKLQDTPGVEVNREFKYR